MSLKDKMLARRDALIRDRADAFQAIEKKQAEIAELERLAHTQFGAIQDVQHWLGEVEAEERELNLAFMRQLAENSDPLPADIDRLLDEARETTVKLDEAIAAAEGEGMTGGAEYPPPGTMIQFPGLSAPVQWGGDDPRKVQAS